MRLMKLYFLLSQILLFALPLRADIAMLLQQPYSTFGAFNPTGHTAIYMSRVCVDSPIELRRCHDGETGAVISRYHRVAGYDWIAIPLIPYLYAVEHPEQVPDFVNHEDVAALRDDYRRKHLSEIIPDAPDGGMPKGDWIQLVGSSYDRKIYGFVIETSEDDDDALIAHLNSQINKRKFSLIYRNCADFVKDVINFYYPKTVRRNVIADAGITTPKQIARLLVKFSERRPDLHFSSFVIPQVSGDIKRSNSVRGVMEFLVRSKKYVAPMIVVSPWIAAGGLTAYITSGRFNPEKYADPVLQPEELTGYLPIFRTEINSAEKTSEDSDLALTPMEVNSGKSEFTSTSPPHPHATSFSGP